MKAKGITRYLFAKILQKPSYEIGFWSILSLLMIHFTTPEYLKYWYIISAMIVMNCLMYHHIVELYTRKLKLFKVAYFVMFSAIVAMGVGTFAVPYISWNPFFRSVSTSLLLALVLIMQISVAILSLGCLRKWSADFKGKSFSDAKCVGYFRSAVVAFALFFTLYLVGMLYGKNHLVVRRAEISMTSLPKNFEGYRIVHLSDFHLGSMYCHATMKRMVDSVNAANADMIVFTGDFVTLCSKEALPYIGLLKQMKAKDGVFAVLGNHDYAKYPYYPSAEVKTADSILLHSIIRDSLGWTLMNDENKTITRGGQSIVVAGSQYIGLPSKSKIKLFGDNPYSFGDLAKTLQGLGNGNAVVLLTHNPVVWSRVILQDYPFVGLTLSGHTHAGQMGYYKKKYSHQYSTPDGKTKAGLYQYQNQYLYINSGIGTSALHSRFLIFPEITIVTLM